MKLMNPRDAVVLAIVCQGERHIADVRREYGNAGPDLLPEYGRLYKIVKEFVRKGWVTTRMEGRKQYLTITPKGRLGLGEFMEASRLAGRLMKQRA